MSDLYVISRQADVNGPRLNAALQKFEAAFQAALHDLAEAIESDPGASVSADDDDDEDDREVVAIVGSMLQLDLAFENAMAVMRQTLLPRGANP
jgi:hypothetical protein